MTQNTTDSSKDSHTPATQQTVPVVAVILAAGPSERFDSRLPKQLVQVGKREVVDWSIRTFEHNERVSDIVVVVSPAVHSQVERIADREKYSKVRMIIDGGVLRSDSVAQAITTLTSAGIPGDSKLLIHDASRPFVQQSTIDACIDELDSRNAAVVASPIDGEVILTEDAGDRKIVRGLAASEPMVVQSPRAFRFSTISKAYDAAAADNDAVAGAGEVELLTRYLPSEEIGIVAGSAEDMSIVTTHDVAAAQDVAKAEALSTVRTMLGSMGS